MNPHCDSRMLYKNEKLGPRTHFEMPSGMSSGKQKSYKNEKLGPPLSRDGRVGSITLTEA